jgi:glyoxylase-like metal-dependent hydrolase (beta-lactamase superfamily II)
MHAPPYSRAICHCLLLENAAGLALVDTGIGLLDVRDPVARIGQQLIELVGFEFDEASTAVRQIEAIGHTPCDVTHIVLTHCDPDHVGGLADFPEATVHVAEEELASVQRGHFRYLPQSFAHGPRWQTYRPSSRRWFGLEAREVELGCDSTVLLVPLFGHTLGHCGVAVSRDGGWLLHVGDAYYLRVETEADDHPVSQLTTQRADDNEARIASLAEIRRLLRDHSDEITLFGYHDPEEFSVQSASP